jgi:thiamine-monophosphate kinase
MGDDAALVRPSARRHILLTTDLLIEGVDFDPDTSSFDQIGHKAMAANLSDIAAMGGIPKYVMVAIALPTRTPMRSLDLLYQGMMRLARRYGVRLIGGDTSASFHGIMVALSVIGEAEQGQAITRSGARPGDRIFVTGSLGNSKAGLEILKRRKARFPYLVRRHLYPLPRVKEGRLLATRRLATAMLDLSDGLASDLRHLCEASRVGARIDRSKIPLSPPLVEYAREKGNDPFHYALTGGEDFELLFTVRPSRIRALEHLQSQRRLTVFPIGEITTQRHGITIVEQDRRERRLTEQGYEHFRVV